MRVRFASLLTTATSFALLMSAAGANAAGPQLSTEGRWITDPSGRVVLLHGVNMVYKLPPYKPEAIGFGRNDAAFLAKHGFNTVRLGVIYAGLEPEPNRYDRGYLDSIAKTQAILAEHGIYSQIDMHQDMYNERFQGEGFPDWAVLDDGLPAAPMLGFPANYLFMPALNRAFDNFWANAAGPDGRGLMDAYARSFRIVAERFRDEPYLMGYDVFNEPWPGSAYTSCANPLGCPAFDTGPLAEMSRRVTKEIRRVDQDNIVWHEPNPIFNDGAQTHLPRIGPQPVGLSFHIYCLTASIIPVGGGQAECNTFDELAFDNADSNSAATGRALLLSEFGATDSEITNRRMVELADEHIVSWQYWHYCDCRDPTTTGTGIQSIVVDPGKPLRGDNVDRAKLDILERPYPQKIAGTPTRITYDERSGTFEVAFKTTKAGGTGRFKRGVSVIYVPREDYPNGYSVQPTGAKVISKPNARLLRVRAQPGSRRVEVGFVPLRGRD